jgi:dTMP kinase
MLGIEVSDEVRGRTFAFVQSLIRIILVLVLAVSPVVAASIGEHEYTIRHVTLNYNGAAFTMLLASIIAISVGVISYKQMKDRPGVSFLSDIKSALRGELGSITSPPTRGLFISFEGGEGSGKSTQTQLLKKWLEGKNRTVVLTREPGGTEIGISLRKILLSKETGTISPRAEALMYAADRAHHVYSLIRPALERGDVVITDRYFDSSIAYQGAGRVLDANEIGRISRWATESLIPTLTIVLDQDPAIGLKRIKETDRLESEPIEFHQRIRQGFLDLAMQDPERYLVIDATQSIEEVHRIIVQKIENLIEK